MKWISQCYSITVPLSCEYTCDDLEVRPLSSKIVAKNDADRAVEPMKMMCDHSNPKLNHPERSVLWNNEYSPSKWALEILL